MEALRLLYVEDEPLIRERVVSKLASRFKEVLQAANGAEGIELYEKHRPDIIVTDAMMPHMNGIEMIRTIRERDKEVKIVLLTALGDINKLSEAINAGIDGYVMKPLDYTTFLAQLKKLADELGTRRQLEVKNSLLLQYKHVVDSSNIVSKTDAKGIITYVNDRFCQISGYEKKELIGKPHSIVRHPDMSKETFKELWQTIQKGRVWEGIVKNLTKDGRDYVVDATIMPIRDLEGNVIEYVGIRHDVTELEQYREILEKQLDDREHTLEEKINMLGEYEKGIDASTSFSRTDPAGRIIYVNDAFCDRTGYPKEELLGEKHSIIRHPDMPDDTFKELWTTITEKKIWKGIIKNRRKDGSAMYTDTTIVPILNTAQEIAEYMSIRHDVTQIVELGQEIEQTQKDIIFTLGAVGESRSKETGMHVKRVAEYSRLFALKLGMEPEEAELLKTASPMHDIGKVAISDSILNKPGRLTPEEHDDMKRHTLIGHEMLKNSDRRLLKTAATIALEHHEKWDGSGYPHGKKGEDIHIYGRITAIADVFDALGSDRVYKKAWELEEILAFFREERGYHFDPRLVDIFFENLEEFLAIKTAYSEL